MTSLIDKWSGGKALAVHVSKMPSHLCDKLLNNNATEMLARKCRKFCTDVSLRAFKSETAHAITQLLSIACRSESWCDIVMQESDCDLVVC